MHAPSGSGTHRAVADQLTLYNCAQHVLFPSGRDGKAPELRSWRRFSISAGSVRSGGRTRRLILPSELRPLEYVRFP